MLRLWIAVVIFTVAQALSALTSEQPTPTPTPQPTPPSDTTRMTTPMMTTPMTTPPLGCVTTCARPPCDNAVTPEGECCPQCPPCEDSSNQCRYWAYNAECQKNPVWMRENCRKSCAVCDAECVDTDQHCKWWSGQGYCDSNPVWMKDNCPVSCDACAPRTTTLAPPSTTVPAPTTTPPPGCFGRDWYLGQQTIFPEPGACRVCTCGDSACAIGDCEVPMCVDASRSSGACCLTCPNGPNCRIRWTGEVITLPVFRNFTSNEGNHFMRCECPPQRLAMPGVQRPEDYIAVCKEVATTTPP